MGPMQTEGVTGEVTRLSRRAEDRLQEARSQVAGTISGVASRARGMARTTHQGVRANPWTALGIGFGAGLILGALAIFAASRR
jgi:ElaB/YqjD/DUF883 family membrane-anchored ribosome-binding protein